MNATQFDNALSAALTQMGYTPSPEAVPTIFTAESEAWDALAATDAYKLSAELDKRLNAKAELHRARRTVAEAVGMDEPAEPPDLADLRQQANDAQHAKLNSPEFRKWNSLYHQKKRLQSILDAQKVLAAAEMPEEAQA